MKLKALLFDMDGTLVDSDPIHIDVFIEFLAKRGVTITEADYMNRMHGRQNVEIFRDFLPGADPDEMDLAKEAAYRQRIATGLDAMPGVRDLIRKARTAGMKTAAVTNGPRANLDAALSTTGLTEEFDYTCSSDDVVHGKPHPEPYLSALTALNVVASEALVFEDSPSGIASASAAGIDVIGVASGLAPAELKQLGAMFAISDFTDPALTRHLDALEGA